MSTESTGIHRFTLGDWPGLVIADVTRALDPETGMPFINAEAQDMQAAYAAYEARTGQTPFEVSMNILLLDTPSGRVMVDTGNGPQGGGLLFERLEAAGISRDSIDLIIITHAHGDHISGLTDGEGNRQFPNARVVIHEVEWDAVAADPNEAQQKHLLSQSDHIERVAAGTEIVPGISGIALPGHAPGQMGLIFDNGDARLVHVADAFHRPLQPEHPEWYIAFDRDPARAVQSRHELFARASSEGWLVLPYHTPHPGFGHVRATDAGYEWQPELSPA